MQQHIKLKMDTKFSTQVHPLIRRGQQSIRGLCNAITWNSHLKMYGILVDTTNPRVKFIKQIIKNEPVYPLGT
jgi:hypothetical protein